VVSAHRVCAHARTDAVLVLGPLYHLTTPADRAKALTEARRVLKPGGWLFGAVISRWASALDGLARDLLQDSRFAAIVQRDLQDGQHRNPTDRLDFFTTAYFHKPSDALKETAGAGFANARVFGIEGPGRMVESEPALIGLSAHLLVVAQKS